MGNNKEQKQIMAANIAIFKDKKIRKTLHNNEWWFSIADVVEALTDSSDACAYWRKLKQRLIEEGSQVVTNCHGLKLLAPDGKMRETDCVDTEGIFRIIQSIPKPNLLNVGWPKSAMSGCQPRKGIYF